MKTIELRVENGAMMLAPAGQPATRLEPAGPSRFLQVDIGVSVDVALPATGPATGMTVRQGELRLEYTRQ